MSSWVSGCRRISWQRDSSGRVEFEERVLGRRADQRHPAGLDPGQQRVLLALGEAVDLVDEQHGAPVADLLPAAALLDDPADVLDPAVTAEISVQAASTCAAMTVASDVLPTPGGPHSNSDRSSPWSSMDRSGVPGRARRPGPRTRRGCGAAAWRPAACFGVVDTHRPRGELRAVEHDVVGPGRGLPRPLLEVVDELGGRRGERVVVGDPALRGRRRGVVGLVRRVEHRRLDDPAELPPVGLSPTAWDQAAVLGERDRSAPISPRAKRSGPAPKNTASPTCAPVSRSTPASSPPT
jgi:hypothetical protein